MRFYRLAPAALGGVLGLMMQVAPHEAASNFSKWAELATGYSPQWLMPQAVDWWGHWVALGLIVAGVIWFLWPLIAGLHRAPEATAAASRPVDALAAPDWPIRDLFFHIQPDVLERSDDGRVWDRVGNEIRDALSLGRLKIWGRPVGDDGPGRVLGEQPAMRLIAPEYWHSAHFTFVFFDDRRRDEAHVYVTDSGLPEYTDLQVNRAEALLVWPLPAAATG